MDLANSMTYLHRGVAILTIPDDVPDHKIEDTFRPTADQHHPANLKST